MEHVLCNLCSSDTTRLMYTGRDRLYKTTPETFSVVRCLQCGLVYTNPRPRADEMHAFYPEAYKPHRQAATNAKKYIPPAHPTKKFIDIGCGGGKLLLHMASLHPGWELHGLDTDQEALTSLQNLGFITHHGTLESIHFPENFFDETNMEHVLEHVPDPLQTLKETHRILKPDGKLTITIPNFRSFSRLVFGSYWYSLETPRHLYHFTPDTLSSLLTKADFHRVQIEYIASPKYFLQSFALWKYGSKSKFPKFIWRILTLPAHLIAFMGFASTMRVTSIKK